MFIAAFTARFWSKVSKSERGCWTWTGSLDHYGYGSINCGGKMIKAHRVAYALTTGGGNMPMSSQWVCHHCDNTKCVNPAHLYLGTPAQNTADMMRRKRHNPIKELLVGEKNPSAKMTPSKVRKIRKLRKAGVSLRAIGKLFGIYNTQVHNIVSGKHWRNV